MNCKPRARLILGRASGIPIRVSLSGWCHLDFDEELLTARRCMINSESNALGAELVVAVIPSLAFGSPDKVTVQ